MSAISQKVPYAFAKANGVLVTAADSAGAEVAVRADVSPGAIAELRRIMGVPLHARRIGNAEFDELVSTLYNGAEEGAAALAGDIAQDLDLSRLLQEIPHLVGRAGDRASLCLGIFETFREDRMCDRHHVVGDP